MGDAVNLAARMETTAEPGTIRVTEATWKLVHRLFESEPLGNVEVRWKSAPVRAYRLTGISSHAASRHRGEELFSPFVGRRAESRLIGRLAADLAKGKSSVIAVIGEPGVGKSRLIAEAEGANPGIGWLRCRAVPYGVRIGDSMARHLLCSLIGAPPDADPEMLDEALRHTLASAVPEASGEFTDLLMEIALAAKREAINNAD